MTGVDATVSELDRALRTHGGGVELEGHAADGALRLRMTGLCGGCLYKPMTVAGTIRPFVEDRLGVGVEVVGARISAEAEERLTRALAGSYRPPRGGPHGH